MILSNAAMCIISKAECNRIRQEHIDYLRGVSKDATTMVYGKPDGIHLDIHQRRLGRVKLLPVINSLQDLLARISSYTFNNFEGVYNVVLNEVVRNKEYPDNELKNPLLLTYDIALRLAFRLDPVGMRLMPETCLYLHAAPYRSARLIAHKIGDKKKIVNGRVDATYLDKEFDCDLCEPAQKEHVLCLKHKLIQEIYGKHP